MKNILSVLLVVFSMHLFAQSPQAWTSGNNIKGYVQLNGVLFQEKGAPAFSHVATPGIHSILSSGIWIGGKDNAKNVYTAIAAYDTSGRDFWPGPIDRSTGMAEDTVWWNHLWQVDSAQVATHKLFYDDVNYQAPWNIANWPGSNPRPGDFNPILAPFIDLDTDQKYEPSQGEFPFFRSKEVIYFILNDVYGTHTQSDGNPMGMEIYGMVQTNNTDPLKNTVFVKYLIINRSQKTYDSVFVGIFTDFMLGNNKDNFISTDTARSMYVCYNGETFDTSGYGANPPVVGVRFLNRKMDKSISISYDNTNFGWPRNAAEYYNLLSGLWRNGNKIMDPVAGTPSSYHFNGDPCAGTGWTEDGSISSDPGRRNMLGSAGPITLAPGESTVLEVAYIFSRNGTDRIDNLCKLQQESDNIQSTWRSDLTSVKNPSTPAFYQPYPNPASGSITFLTNNQPAHIRITDAQGKSILEDVESNGTISMQAWNPGIYFYQVTLADGKRYAGKFVKK